MNNKLSWLETTDLFNLHLKKILYLILISMVVMLGFRLLAHSSYETWSEISSELSQRPQDLWQAYWIGGRFDLSALCYIVLLPIVSFWLALIFRSRRIWDKARNFAQIYLFVLLALLALCLACDVGYYSYFQDHLNVLIFAIFEDDTKALLMTFWKNYPLLWFGFGLIIFIFVLFRGLQKIWSPPVFRNFKPSSFLYFPLVLSFPAIFLGARGSVNLFPLSVQDTVISDKAFLNYLAYNGFHALIRAVKLKKTQNSNWNAHLLRYSYEDPKQAFADFYEIPLSQVPEDPNELLKQKSHKNPWAEKRKPHVLVMMMESLGSAYFQYQSPQFDLLGEFETHFKKNFSSLHFLPGHNSTIGSLSSFMISMPQRPEAGFLTETESLQSLFPSSAARVFKSQNYKARFVYGGNPGWRDVNKFALFQGFDRVEGEVDIEKSLGPLPEKHDWGVFDEDVFRYLEKTLLEETQPQFILAMTTSNHPPYQIPTQSQPQNLQIPESLQKRLVAEPDLVQKRFASYRYSNQKLGEFLTRIQNSPLKENLIVAVTGDHSFWIVSFGEDELLQKWGVPLMISVPEALKKDLHWDPQVYGSHFDLFPTIYNLALSEVSFIGPGRNLFQNSEKSWAAHSSSLALSKDGGILALKGPKDYTPLAWTDQGHLQPSQPNDALDRLAKKYKSLMSITDYYLMSQNKGRAKK